MSQAAERGAGRGLSTVWRILGGAALLIAVIAVMAMLVEHDASAESTGADVSIRELLRQNGYLAGFALIYIEESGIPLFIPGDAFLLYVGHRLPQNWPVFLAAWLGFILAVTLGATNLYLVARRYGRRLLDHRLGGWLHLTHNRLALAEKWFDRWGPLALIFGRHIPGLRVPLTVAAGVLQLPYRIFAISVAISSSAWAAAFLLLGAVFGESVARSIRSTPLLYGVVLAGSVATLILIVVVRRIIEDRGRSRS